MDYKRAIFLDKDGTVIPNIPYNIDPDKITIAENASAGLKKLQDLGYLLIIISNQSGVARGLFTEEELDAVQWKIESLLGLKDITLSGFYFCPHHPDGSVTHYAISCTCRKPSPGLFHQAAEEIGIDLSRSWMIGDILDDVEAGHRAGCRSILLNNGNETLWKDGSFRKPTYITENITEAADYIIKTSHHGNQDQSFVPFSNPII